MSSTTYDETHDPRPMTDAADAPSQPRPSAPVRRTRAPGERSRRQVLEHAARLASIDGLDGLSIGRLAAAADMPKSSVYVLFGSKEELQLATVDAARASFLDEVVGPALSSTAGVARLRALCDGYVSYIERRVFPTGCFFVGAAVEVGARPGRVHDRVAEYQQQWRDLLGEAAREAHQRGELHRDDDPEQVAFELGALLAGAGVVAVLHDDDVAIERARRAVRARLALGTDQSRGSTV